jgi:hypothetical protein
MDQSCLVCCEDFNQSKNCKVSCPWCDFSACRSCCQTYILDQEASVCMNKSKKSDGSYICQKEWSRKFITDSFPKCWVNKQWKGMNQELALQRETALMPATMAVVEQRKEIEQMKHEVEEIEDTMNRLHRRRANLKHQIEAGGSVTTSVNSAPGTGRKCPDENCRGYMSSQWKCGLCDKWACSQCHVLKGSIRDAEHTCDPDTLATAKLLDKDTKPCPKCSTLIHKIEGCDQMWCTQCHTAFSWRRGTIETRIHNPHYYEWQRNNNGGTVPRNLGDFECGRDLGDQRATRYISQVLHRTNVNNKPTYSKLSPNDLNQVINVHTMVSNRIQKTIHLVNHDGNRFRTDNVVDNLELRVKYLKNDIDAKSFASKVHTAWKAHEKKKDISNVIQLQVQGMTDIVYRFADCLKSKTDRDNGQLVIIPSDIGDMCSFLGEMEALTDYSNNVLEEHSKTYGCKKWTINYDQKDWVVLR